ncbi:MAG: hypothetical protein U1F56_00840 [Rubrivivax sp.]
MKTFPIAAAALLLALSAAAPLAQARSSALPGATSVSDLLPETASKKKKGAPRKPGKPKKVRQGSTG